VPFSEPGRYAGSVWRFVEDQNLSSTMKLVDGTADQATLEALLDETKPPVPEDCAHLHYLMFTPFRYPARTATRYRPAGERRGVFYAAEAVATAAAEVAFYRLLFFLESPETVPPERPFEMTAFRVRLNVKHAVDLRRETPERVVELSDPVDYAPCHALAAEARTGGVGAIRYPSVRTRGWNVALLDCAGFAGVRPTALEGWWFRFSGRGLFAVKRFGEGRLDFPVEMFAGDPRVRG